MKKHILAHAVGIPIVAAVFYSAHQALIWHAVAIGDTANPALSPIHDIGLDILNFPMMYLYVPLGDWLEPLFTDNGVLRIFSGINGLVWGLGIVSLGTWIKKRAVEHNAAH